MVKAILWMVTCLSLLGVIWLIGSLTDGSATWMLFGLSAWALSILLVLWFFSRLFRLNRQQQMSRLMRGRLIQNSRYPLYERLKPPSVLPDGETPDSAIRRSG
mgnify:CR=1 FL=1